MANNFNSMPISLDTDVANFGAAQTLQARPFGLRVWKIELYSVGASTAGTVTVTEPNSGIQLLGPMAVAAGATAGSLLFYDNPTQLLQWPANFAVTGLTATGTRLLIWYRV
jgi:hypothetical protein